MPGNRRRIPKSAKEQLVYMSARMRSSEVKRHRSRHRHQSPDRQSSSSFTYDRLSCPCSIPGWPAKIIECFGCISKLRALTTTRMLWLSCSHWHYLPQFLEGLIERTPDLYVFELQFDFKKPVEYPCQSGRSGRHSGDEGLHAKRYRISLLDIVQQKQSDYTGYAPSPGTQ